MRTVSTSKPDVMVVGAGIAGLVAAIALDQAGMSVQIIERATALTPGGGALTIWPSAQAALERIGLATAVADIGFKEPNGTICDWSGRVITKLDQSRLHEQLGTPTLSVHRGDLQQMLLDAASRLPVRLQTPARRVGSDGAGAFVELTGGEMLRATVVLACDGVRSIARTLTENPAPRYSGRTSFRAVLDSDDLVSEACLSAGQGMQFISSPMVGGRTYWAADVGMPEGANEALGDRKGFLSESFTRWHHPVSELIERTPAELLVIADVYESMPKTLKAGRVALLGDAAHPMRPDLAQGACQGIEDGVVLAACLARHHSPDTALANYETARLRRVRSMVRESRRLNRLATTQSAVLSGLRNVSVAHMPGWLNRSLVARYSSEQAFLRTVPSVM
jgi:2-polyprenyl-6-methoxyphenol hydroxylase-like FAD-dependent oxidoreductase